MTNRYAWLILGVLAILLAIPAAQAKVSPEQAARLGKDLTPLGAIRAGNAEGTIPGWEGGITKPIPEYKPGKHHPDPFAGDQPLFTITAANVDQYAGKLSPGQVAMLKRYPKSWRMTVYPTRRSAAFPQHVYDRAIANTATAELASGGNGVVKAIGGVPFPIPNEGVEAIWNHIFRYRGETLDQITGQVAPTAGGAYTFVRIRQEFLWRYQTPGLSSDALDNRLFYFIQTVMAPARLAGDILLVHEPINQVEEPRKAWVYNPGQRRVRRAPNVAYDNPGTASDSQRTNDQNDMFNGTPDRYNWTLVGRREMYVPYNSYKLHSDKLSYDDIVKPGHINPDFLRYELHRVWVVEAKLKEGTSHIYARRTFYIDEDSWQILAVDQYDSRGDIWRVSEAHVINYYQVPLLWQTLEAHYDLQNGRYLAIGLNNQERPEIFNTEMDQNEFTPDALRRLGRR
jgi:hypothetical protein